MVWITANRPLIVLLVLVATPAFAGCLGDDDDGRPEESLFDRLRRNGESLPLEEYRKLVETPAPPDCEGCIPLTPPVPEPTPAPPAKPSITIPYPTVGDHLRVTGDLSLGLPWGLGSLPVPADEAGHYDLTMRFAAHDETPLLLYDGDDATVMLYVAALNSAAADTDGTWLLVEEQRVWVSLRTRMAVEALERGHAVVDSEAVVPTVFGASVEAAERRLRPDAGHLFHLGGHLWGRNVTAGDRILGSWTADGADAPTVRYEYKVVRVRDVIAPGATAYNAASHGETADIIVTALFRDAADNTARYFLHFDDQSAFPVHIEMTSSRLVAPDHVRLPVLVSNQDIRVVARGDHPIGWAPAPLPGSAQDAAAGDLSFTLGERRAPPVLDALPAYPLSYALADVELAAGFLPSPGPDDAAHLVEATLVPRRLVDAAPGTVELEWRLSFWEPDAGAFAWIAARMVAADGNLAPAPHRVAYDGTPQFPAFLFMDPFALLSSPLGAGDILDDAWRDLGAGRAVDSVLYRLWPADDGLDGALTLGSAEPMAAVAGVGDASPAVMLTEDLDARRIVAARWIGAP